ncbi:MAG: selenocysteine-specific translation elongation factor [Planctomycetota bacterium]
MPGDQINITLGTAGHIDHGKTALVKLLTGCETDRLKAEKERRISIDLGFAPCTVSGLEIGIVDVPGHENFIKTMVAGAAAMDAVMLVVAADDGIMPQTREHMEILTLLGVRHGFVALTKIDRVDPDVRQQAADETKAYLRDTFLKHAPVCPISSVTGEGFDHFYETLTTLIESLHPKSLDGVFRLPVDRAFSAHGYGTVVAGVPIAGTIGLGDELELLPEGSLSRIRHIEVYGQESEVVRAGQCAAINVRHWDAKDIQRGHVVALPGYFTAERWFVGQLQLLPEGQASVKNGMQLKLHVGTAEVTAKIYLMEKDTAEPGEECLVQFRTAAPIVAGPSDRFIVRSLSPVRTIGGGMIVEAIPGKLKRSAKGLVDDLRRRRDVVPDKARFLEYAIRHARSGIANEAELATRTKTRREQTRTILADLLRQQRVTNLPGGQYLHRDTAENVKQRVLDCITTFHQNTPESPGVAFESLRQELQVERPILQHVLTQLRADRLLAERNGHWAAPRHSATFQGEDAKHGETIDNLFRTMRFRPPSMDDVRTQTGLGRAKVETLLKTLQQHGRLVRVEADLYFHREAVEAARDIMVEFLQREGRLESVKFKYLLDTSRKFAIPLLDYLDTLGLTRRDDHTRYLKE